MREQEEIEAKLVEAMDSIEASGGSNAETMGIRAALEWVLAEVGILEAQQQQTDVYTIGKDGG